MVLVGLVWWFFWLVGLWGGLVESGRYKLVVVVGMVLMVWVCVGCMWVV